MSYDDDSDPGWNSDHDSTWWEEAKNPKYKKQKRCHQYNFWNRAAVDMQNYRHGYSNNPIYSSDYLYYMPNLAFYQNKIRFEPNGVTIEEFHRDWKRDYSTLEMNHSYIQWLFPLQEHGVNPQATPLTLNEIQKMKEDKDVMRRFLESYKLMLGFYGIYLLDMETGEVTRGKNWEKRFHNLDNRSHNNLRITRILKCLGELGYDHFQVPLVRFFLEETLCEGTLQNVKRSVLDYFMFTVRNKSERKKLVHFAWENYRPQERFIWGPEEILRDYRCLEEMESEDEKDEIERDYTHKVNENGKAEERDLIAEKVVEESKSSGNERGLEETIGNDRPIMEEQWSENYRKNENREYEREQDTMTGSKNGTDGNYMERHTKDKEKKHKQKENGQTESENGKKVGEDSDREILVEGPIRLRNEKRMEVAKAAAHELMIEKGGSENNGITEAEDREYKVTKGKAEPNVRRKDPTVIEQDEEVTRKCNFCLDFSFRTCLRSSSVNVHSSATEPAQAQEEVAQNEKLLPL